MKEPRQMTDIEYLKWKVNEIERKIDKNDDDIFKILRMLEKLTGTKSKYKLSQRR